MDEDNNTASAQQQRTTLSGEFLDSFRREITDKIFPHEARRQHNDKEHFYMDEDNNTASAQQQRTTLSGEFLDSFRREITDKIFPHEARRQHKDSPGAILHRWARERREWGMD